MHGNYNATLVFGPDIYGMAAALTAKFKAQLFDDTDKLPRFDRGQLFGHAEISIGLIRMSSVGIGRPSSMSVSM